jgi:Protein of unknown function (DUF2721)
MRDRTYCRHGASGGVTAITFSGILRGPSAAPCGFRVFARTGRLALQSTDITHLIQLAVAPVFLLSGVGVTLGVLTNRLARIVDRARVAEKEMQSGAADVRALERLLGVLRRRARYINFAIAASTLSAVLVSLCVVMLFVHALSGATLTTAIAATFVASMLSLTAGLVAFLVEVRISMATLTIGGER